MQVTVFTGDNFAQTNAHVLQLATQPATLDPVFVLVPDRFTLQAERLLLQHGRPLLNTRVITFSMLFQILAEELNQGQLVTQVLDKTTAVLHLWTAIKAVQDDLVWFKKSASHYDFADKLYNTLNQMRSSRVDFARLPAQAKSTVARKKYQDINLIYQKYQTIIQEQTDSSGMLAYLIEHLPASQNLRHARFYLCGFTSFSPARLAVVQAICQHVAQVQIAASAPELITQLAAYPQQKLVTTPFQATKHSARCVSPRQEAEVVAQKIVNLLNQGVPPEQIIVLLTEFNTLAPVWQVVLDAYQIPVNLDVGQKLSETAAAKYLRDLITLALNDNAENTLSVLYNVHSGFGDELAALDNTIVQHNWRAAQVPNLVKLQQTKDLPALCAELMNLTTEPKLLTLLTKLAQAPGLTTLNLREFQALFWSLCQATKVSDIPLYVDRVLIAPADDWVPTAVPYLFIANCTAENFPRGQADNDILQEADLVGTAITPTPSLQRWRNYQQAQLIMSVATQAVMLSGPNEDFLPGPELPPATGHIYHDQQPITVGQALFLAQPRVRTTMLEKYYSCPYLNFWENGLHLQPRPLYELRANDLGSAIHQALETYFRGSTIAQAVAAGVAQLTYQCPPLVDSLRQEITFIINQLVNAFAAGAFRVHALEYPIQKPLGAGLTLVGRVDRIDVAQLPNGEQAYLVLDYKTGHAPSNIAKNIYLGSKLQLPLYASALRPLGHWAGAGYLALPSGYTPAVKKIQIKGLIDEAFTDLFAPGLLPTRSTQNLTSANLALIGAHADRLVNQAIAALQAGDTTAQAVDSNVCQYCPVQWLCPNAHTNFRGADRNYTFQDFNGGEQ